MITVEKVLGSIDFKKIENLLEGYFKSTGMVVGLLDLDGKILATSSWQPICKNYHRANKASCKRCTESDLSGAKLAIGKDYHSYNCLNGLVDVVAPVIINELHVANLYCGQFLYIEPDIEKFKKQAGLFGFDQEKYLEALAIVPIISEEKIKDVMAFLKDLILQVSEMSMHKNEQEKLIKEIKNTETTLRKSEERLATSQRIALLGSFEHDFKKDTIWWSDEVYKILGFSKSDIPPAFKTFISRMNKEDQQKVRKLVDQCKKHGKGYSTTYGYQIPGEEIKYILDTVEVVSDSNGKPTGLNGTVQDITDQVKTEKAKQDSERNYQTLFKSAPIMLGVVNKEGNYLEVNKAVYEMLGYTDEDIKGENVFGFIHEEDTESVIGAFTEAVQKGSGEVTYRFKHKNGGYRTIRSKAEHIPNTENYIIFSDDITDRIKAEKDLKESEELLNLTGEISKVGGWYLDNENNLYWTQTTKIIHEIPDDHQPTVEEAINYYHPDDKELVAESVEAAISGGKPFDLEARLITAKGKEIWVHAMGQAEMFNGKFKRLLGTFQDITERKKADDALKESQENYRGLVEDIIDVIFELDVNGTIKFVSSHIVKMLGYEPEYLIGKHFRESVFQDDLEISLAGFENHKNGDAVPVEFRMVNSSGNTIWISILGKIIPNKNIFRGVMRDISSRKLTEHQLEEKNEFIQKIIDDFPIGIATNEIDSLKVTSINSKFAEIYGWPPEEFPTTLDFFNKVFPNKEYREELLTRIMADIESGDPNRMHWDNLRITTKSGEERLVYAFNIPFPDQNIMVSTVQDITEKKKVENELRENERFISAIADTSPAMIYVYDIETNSNVYSNSGMSRILGYSPQEILEMGETLLSDLVHPDDFHRVIEIHNNILEASDEEILFIEYRIKHKDGSWRYMHSDEKVFKRKPDGSVKQKIGIAFEITEQKQAENKLISNQQRLSAIFDNTSDYQVLVEVDPKHYFNIVAVNNSYIKRAKELGINIESGDLVGKSIRELLSSFGIPADETEQTIDNYVQVANSKKKIEFIEDILINDNPYYAEISLIPILDENDNCIYILYNSHDITERKVAEDNLLKVKVDIEESEEKYRLLHENAGLGIGYYTPEGIVVSFNSIASKHMGGEPSDFVGKSIYELFPKEAAEEYKRRLNKALEKDEADSYEDFISLPDKDRWYLSTYTKIVNSANNVLGIQIISQDITAIKESETDLKIAKERAEESEKSLVTAQNIAKTGSWYYLPQEDKGYWSEQMYILFGLTKSSQTPSFEEFFELIHPDDIEIATQEYNKALDTKETRSYDCRTNPEKKNIRAKWVNISISTITSKGQIIKLNGTITDITERKHIEEQIAYQSKMQEILTNLASSFINIPLSQVSTAIESALTNMGMFINADRAYIFEYDWDKMITKNTYEWCADGVTPEKDNLQEVPLSSIPRWAETHRNGDKMLIPDTAALEDEGLKEILQDQGIKSLLTIPMMTEEDCIGFVGFDSVNEQRTYSNIEETLLLVFSKMLVNITQRKLVEGELLAAKEKAEESDKLKSAFLANMSHEIRTPMNGILGFADLLQEQNLSGDKKDKYVEIIRKSGNRMLETLNDIIDISRIDSGQMDIHKSITDLNELIESQFIFFKQEALNKGLGLKLFNELDKQDSFIEIDKVKLNSIVSNLIKNAIKYTNEGSIEIFCIKVGPNLEIKVKDTGIGIPKDRINSIFNRFEQADINDKQAREGSGLGLSITKAYVEMLGGEIGVNSTEGKGSAFWCTIPWDTKNKETPSIERKTPESESISDNKKHYNILVVEDDDISFDHMNIILDTISKHTVRAKNGKDAVEYIKNNSDTELVLMDIKLPIMSGTDATREIRKFNKDVIIIAQTAYGLSGDSQMAFDAGCNDYISKPINKERLFDLIEKHLG